MNPHAIYRALREAIVTMCAMLATLACTLSIAPETGPGVLAVVLCLSLSRSHLDRDRHGRIEAAVALPLVGLVAVGVGHLLLHWPWVGAMVFVTGMTVSIWLRRFGPMTRRAGSLIALPFVAILVTPYVPTRHASPWLAALMPIIVALLALGWVTLFHALARRMRVLAPVQIVATHVAAPAPTSSLRPVASTRMAIQMAGALGVSFVIGYVFFAERWVWIVLTAFIVNSGNRGRLDVAYKSVLRVVGAAAGTLLALSVTLHLGNHDTTTIVLMLAAVFFGIWLRPLSYAWWALFVTMALALLQGFEGAPATQLLALRLQEIVIGAVIGVASAWIVYPIRSTDVLRRRIADALATLADTFDPDTPKRDSHAWQMRLADVAQLAPPFRASLLITCRIHALQPADWIDALLGISESASTLIERGESPGDVRKAIGSARRALREPEQLKSALQDLGDVLNNAAKRSELPTRQPATTPGY